MQYIWAKSSIKFGRIFGLNYYLWTFWFIHIWELFSIFGKNLYLWKFCGYFRFKQETAGCISMGNQPQISMAWEPGLGRSKLGNKPHIILGNYLHIKHGPRARTWKVQIVDISRLWADLGIFRLKQEIAGLIESLELRGAK